MSVAFTALLIFGQIFEEMQFGNRLLVSIMILTFSSYITYKNLKTSGRELDVTLFHPYPITTLETLDKNIREKEITEFFIGTFSQLENVVKWKSVSEHLKLILGAEEFHDPDVRTRTRNALFGSSIAPNTLLGVHYADDNTYQFSKLELESNDLLIATKLIDTYRDNGVQISGSYEQVKKQLGQRNNMAKALQLMMIVVIIVTVITAAAILMSQLFLYAF